MAAKRRKNNNYPLASCWGIIFLQKTHISVFSIIEIDKKIKGIPMTTINTNPYLATTDESERPAINSIPYLVRLSGGAGVTSGYYYNEKFYKDAAHTQEITPKPYQLYLDITDGENKLYTYDGTEYVVVSGGGGAITITGHVNTVSDLPSVTEVEEGTAYAVGTTQPYDIYVAGYESGAAMPSWINIGPIRGPKGDTGDDGEDGEDGATFTPSVSAAGVISWTNDGGKTNPDPVNIKGPQGNPGADGKIQDVQVNGSSKVTGTTANITTVQNLTSATSTEPLAANQGKILNDRINNLQNIGRFLAIWNASTGLPATNPPEMPYSYKTGDYYRVGTIARESVSGPASMGTITLDFATFKSATYLTTGLHYIWYDTSMDMWGLDDMSMPGYTSAELGLTYTGTAIDNDQVNINLTTTNYKPNGSSYDGTQSSTVETETITEGSVYYYDGTTWKLQTSGGGGTVLDVQIDNTSILSGGVADFTSEAFTFTLANGTTVTKNILVKE